MKSWTKTAFATASLIGAAFVTSAPAGAQVHLGVGIDVPGARIGVGVGAPAYYYGPGYYPPGPCDAYDRYYSGDCGYAVYNGPVVLGGVAVGGPHYYRWFDGRPMFWYRGGWHYWSGWTRANYGWDHGEGWGWRGGHWDRGWGNDHWRGDRGEFHGDRDRGGDDYRHDRGEHRGHGNHDR